MTNMILKGVVGSKAYGLDTPESDTDKMGIFITPTAELLSLRGSPVESVQEHDPDRTYHEVGKFMKMYLAGNPNVLELLWLDDYEIRDPESFFLFTNREAWLSRRVRDAYRGYAKQQFHRLERKVLELDKRPEGKSPEKLARHLIRLCQQGAHIWQTGEVQVRLPNGEAIKDAAAEIVNYRDMRLAEDHLNRLRRITNEDTQLPRNPDMETAETSLLDIRKRNF